MTKLAQSLNFYDEAVSGDLPGVVSNIESDKEGAFGTWISGLLSAMMIVGALLLLVYLLWGAIEWITSGGDSGKVQKARDKMTQAAIGLIVLAASLAIFMAIQQFLGLAVINF